MSSDKFKPPDRNPAKPRGYAIHFNLPQDIYLTYHEQREASGLSHQAFIAAMFRHCLADMVEKKCTDEQLIKIANLARNNE